MEGSTKIISVIQSLLALLRDKASKNELGGITNVYDYVPEGKPMPFMVIGEVTSNDDGTKMGYGEQITIDIEIWSKNRGKYKDLLTAKSIQDLFLNYTLTNLPDAEEFIVISQNASQLVSRELDYGVYLTILQLKLRIQ